MTVQLDDSLYYCRTISTTDFRYCCTKCLNVFSLVIKNEDYNIEVKCPRCGYILKKKKEIEK